MFVTYSKKDHFTLTYKGFFLFSFLEYLRKWANRILEIRVFFPNNDALYFTFFLEGFCATDN